MFQSFPNTLKVKVIETSEVVQLGGVQAAQHLDLKYLQLVIYVHGTMAGTEKLRARVFPDQAMACAALATSSYSQIASITNLGTHWIGRLRFDFNGEPLNKNTRYWIGLDASGYTRNADTLYIGAVLDYNFAQVSQPTAAWMALYGYRYLG